MVRFVRGFCSVMFRAAVASCSSSSTVKVVCSYATASGCQPVKRRFFMAARLSSIGLISLEFRLGSRVASLHGFSACVQPGAVCGCGCVGFTAAFLRVLSAQLVAGDDVTKLASMAKLKAGRLARDVTDSCLQFWGGMGYTNDVLISRMYRCACDVSLRTLTGGCQVEVVFVFAGTCACYRSGAGRMR